MSLIASVTTCSVRYLDGFSPLSSTSKYKVTVDGGGAATAVTSRVSQILNASLLGGVLRK